MNFCMQGVIVFQRNRRYAAQGGGLRLFSTNKLPLCGSIRNIR